MRTTAIEVKEIMDDTALTDAIVNAYIKSANLFVTNHLGASTLDTDTLADIERWVAAHAIAMTRERQAKKEEAGSAKVEYGIVFGVGLLATSYGQMAIALDSTGTLQTIADGKTLIKLIAL